MQEAEPPAGAEWDARKAASNAKKHGVTFDEAVVALAHPLAYTMPVPQEVGDEVRDLTFAPGPDGRLLAVVHTRRGNNVRIISARRANQRERRNYVKATEARTQ